MAKRKRYRGQHGRSTTDATILDYTIGVAVNRGTMAWVQAQADREGVTVSKWLRWLVQYHREKNKTLGKANIRPKD